MGLIFRILSLNIYLAQNLLLLIIRVLQIQVNKIKSVSMTNKREQKLQEELKNIGPAMAKKLVNIGVDSPENYER